MENLPLEDALIQADRRTARRAERWTKERRENEQYEAISDEDSDFMAP